MFKFKSGLFILAIYIFASEAFTACSPAGGNSTGHEYMPDMAHSIAGEANVIDEYSTHTWNKQSTRTLIELYGKPRLPIKGTIPRGSVGLTATNFSDAEYKELSGQSNRGISTPINGNVPYYYADTDEERIRATKEIAMNPLPITKENLAKGKELWTIYCGICHGTKCAGNGYLVSDENPNAKYPAQPANLLLDTFANGNNGRIYHAMMYGKNVMGNYADKLSYTERWQVIHYIRKCQADDKKMQYDENQNVFRPLQAISDSAYRVNLANSRTINKSEKKVNGLINKLEKKVSDATKKSVEKGTTDKGTITSRF